MVRWLTVFKWSFMVWIISFMLLIMFILEFIKAPWYIYLTFLVFEISTLMVIHSAGKDIYI